MKKIKCALFLFFYLTALMPALAVNIGTYKSDTEYGLIDGFKFNVFGRREGEKMIQLKSETQEEKERLEREKEKPPEKQDEYQLFKFIQENTVPF
ncbi:TPA: hypothetical protein IAA68_03240 [Candidatus Galligastranaerophilus faecipullorum]|mgnify:FL=1|nr:hypothetical protein [Candidatus Galligastranaerophilus faecipullorum]